MEKIMNKITLICLVGTTALFSFDGEVKKAPITLLINEESKDFKADDKFTLNAGDIVCFTKGDGRLVIVSENYKKQLSKRNKACKHLPNEDGTSIDYNQGLKHSVVSIFENSKEKSTNGVSRKSLETETLTVPIYIGDNAKYLAIENSSWGPLPVTLELIDKKGKMIETMINEDDVRTSFILPKNLLKDGYIVKVSNTFGDLLVNSKVHF